MRSSIVLSALTFLCASVTTASEGRVVHEATWSTADLDQAQPADLVDPTGTTRWELEALVSSGRFTRTIREFEDGTLSVLDTRSAPPAALLYGAQAHDWWLPHLAAAHRSEPLQFAETGDRDSDLLFIRTRPLGSGWVFLPSGPREARLERAYVMRSAGGKAGFVAEQVVYRWIDPRAGVVAEAWGRPSPDGSAIVELQGATTIESLIQGGLPLKIYAQEIEVPNFERLTLGFDRRGKCTVGGNSCVDNGVCVAGGGDECKVPISEVTTVAHATMGDVIAASSWDFSPTQLADSRYEVGSTFAPINSAETCNYNQCGFATTANMGREDKNFNDTQDSFITLSAVEGEQRAGDYTIWLRGAVRWEGRSGGLGEGESRTCNDGIDTNGDTRPEVPLWRFDTQDAGGWFMQSGDSWTHTPFNCEQSVFNHICPASCGLFCPIWIQGCSGLPGQGTQASAIIKEGPVTTPSGHTINTLLVRQVVDFCVYLGNSCGFEVDRVHQAIYLWVAPNLGTIARLMSGQNETSDTAFTHLQETDIKYGLFPPRSITSTGETAATIGIAWDPGTVTHHIDGYKVYWDTDSGASTPYAFDSVANPGQVSIVGTTATISGLTAGTDYYISVTALSDFTDVSTGVMTTYESLLFPTATASAGAPLPPELVATTTGGACTPTAEVTGLTLDKPGPCTLNNCDVEFCWTASTDPCVDGYSVLASPTGNPVDFAPLVPDTGLATCTTVDTTDKRFFLVVGKGTGGAGPWGHFGM